MTRPNLHRDCTSVKVVYAFMFINVIQSMLMYLMWYKYDELLAILITH
jgi:hypothetical protein